MPAFFVGKIKNPDKAEEAWTALVKFAELQGFNLTSRRIFQLHYRHDSQEYVAQVGLPEEGDASTDIVWAILESDPFYLVCKTNRGAVRGTPILVGKHHAHSAIDFD